MIQLSIVIIAFNEERSIGRCLDSVKAIADEIVVVDSYSTDKTVEICRAYGAKIISHAFEGHIQQKNYALENSTFLHVLSLDADEVLSDELRASISSVKTNWIYDGYEMNRLTNYCGTWIRHGSWYPDRKIRLFDKRRGRWTGINPHDRFEMNESSSTLGFVRGDILHYSYYSISDHIKQVDYFTEISARILFEKKKKASLVKLIGAPIFRFLRDYLLKFGFMDGYYGFLVCMISSHAVFLKYAKLHELWKQERR